MGAVLEFAAQLESLSCGECGIHFAVPIWWLKEKRDKGGTFTCPNGHARVFKESENARLKKELEAEKQRTENEERRRREAEERAERNWKTLRQTQGKLNATKKRVGNGVCPCCNRTFKQLARHMDAKHPDYKQPEPEVGATGG